MKEYCQKCQTIPLNPQELKAVVLTQLFVHPNRRIASAKDYQR